MNSLARFCWPASTARISRSSICRSSSTMACPRLPPRSGSWSSGRVRPAWRPPRCCTTLGTRSLCWRRTPAGPVAGSRPCAGCSPTRRCTPRRGRCGYPISTRWCWRSPTSWGCRGGCSTTSMWRRAPSRPGRCRRSLTGPSPARPGPTGLTMSALANKAFAPVTVPATGPIEDQVQAWAKLIAQYDTYSTYQYLVQRAGWDFPTLSAVGTLENMTSRLHYSMFPVLWDRGNISPNVRYWELTNGTASLTEALTARLAPIIRQDRRMIRLTQDASGVGIQTTAESGTEDSVNGGPVKPVETFTADYVIVAVPLSALRFCQFEPVLSYRKRRAIGELHYDSATKVLLEFKTRFWEQGPGGFTGGGCVSDSANRFTYFPSHVPGSPGGVVLASYTWSDEAMRWDALTLDERCYFALRNMAHMFGRQVYTQFTGVGATQSWARARYALGEAVIFTPGQLHEHHLATATVEGRAHFAGDHTSMKPAWIEGALESAVRSALEVTARA